MGGRGDKRGEGVLCGVRRAVRGCMNCKTVQDRLHACTWKYVSECPCGHCLGGPALLTAYSPSPVALGQPCLSCNGNGTGTGLSSDRHPPSSSVPGRPACHTHASLDRHLANAAILDCFGRLLLLLLLLVLLLHTRMLLLLPPPSYPSPLQGQLTHTSSRTGRSESTREDTHWARNVEYEKARAKASSYSPPWTPGRSP